MTAVTQTWTTTGTGSQGFGLGVFVNTNDSAVANQVQLISTQPTTFRYVAVPRADSINGGTLVRIDADTGAIVGQYFTAPAGFSRTPYALCVDSLGNVWVGNKDEQSVNSVSPMGSCVKVGLLVGGTPCNANGADNPAGLYRKSPFQYNTTGADPCLTSHGLGSTGDVDGLGALSWPNFTDGVGGGSSVTSAPVADALDDALLVYQRTDCKLVHSLAVDASNNVWVGGWSGTTTIEPFDKLAAADGNRLTVVPGGAAGTTKTGGRGGFISATPSHEYVWSCDPTNPAISGSASILHTSDSTEFRFTNQTGDFWYGLCEDSSTGNLYLSTGTGTANRVMKLNHEGTQQLLFGTSSVAVMATGPLRTAAFGAGSVWVVSSAGHVYRLNATTGAVQATVDIPSPDGICVASHSDGVPRVWVCVDLSTPFVYRIHTGTNTVDLTVPLGTAAGCSALGPLMAGSVTLTAVYPSGSWGATFDAGDTVVWTTIAWHDTVPAGQTLVVQYRISNDNAGDYTTAATVTAEGLTAHSVAMTGTGRFADVLVLFQRPTTDSASSTLRDVTITGTVLTGSTHATGHYLPVDDIPLDDTLGTDDGMATGTGALVGCAEVVGAVEGMATVAN